MGRPQHHAARLQTGRRKGRESTVTTCTSGTGRKRKIARSIDLGEKGMVPLEVRFHHNPASPHGFVGAALSSSCGILQGRRRLEGGEGHRGRGRSRLKGRDFPVPGLHQRLVRLAGRSLAVLFELAARGRPAVRHPRPVEAEADRPGLGRRRAWAVGSGRRRADRPSNRPWTQTRGGPQMLQLSLDGKRLYVTDSLYSSGTTSSTPGSAKKVRICCGSIATPPGAACLWTRIFASTSGPNPTVLLP